MKQKLHQKFGSFTENPYICSQKGDTIIDYYVGKYDQIFVMEKRKDFFKRMIKNCDKRIEELKGK